MHIYICIYIERALAGGNKWDSLSCLSTLFEIFDKNNLEMRIDSVARQIHQRTVGGVPHLKTS